jgi:aryl-phospho-beta-D-glucosidase BglC (GH1 family)
MKRTICGVLLVLLTSTAWAQVNNNTPGWFPFNVPGDDASRTPMDLSSLNPKPAGKDGFLRAEAGVIKDGAGRRVRWFGFNFTGDANLPPRSEAPKIAAHLAKLGVNIVRLHFLDFNWGPGSLLNYPDNGPINPGALDRLDSFISELKKQGIYVNLNLHVGRAYTGTPSGYDFSKGLDHFYPPYIAQFKQYVRDLVTHVNPYTGATYADEPAVACIEVNNENTFGMFPPTQLASLPEPFAGELKRQWTAWLRGKYQTTEGLRAAWGVNDGSVGANVVPNPNFINNARGWVLENHDIAQSRLDPIPDGTPGIRWTVTRAGTADWHLQLNHPRLNVIEGGPYRLTFRARATAPRSFSASVMLDQDPWTGCGLWARQNLTTAWQTFSYDFVATGTVPNHVRVNFSANNEPGVRDIADVSLRAISSGALRPDETFENDNIPFTASSGNLTARRDFIQFLIETERNHALEMRRYVKEELGAKQIVYHSQVNFGGMAGAFREQMVGDLVDSHAYWQHPEFPGRPWDPVNWLIRNTTQLAEANGGEMAGLGMMRVQGKPFTVSEYNTPAPSDYSAETWPLLAAMAGFQDWDGIYYYTYLNFGNDYYAGRILNFFDAQGHPAQMAFTPLAALLFRNGLVAPGRQTVVLTASERQAINDQTDNGMWGSFDRFWGQAGLSRAVALRHKTALNPVSGEAPTSVNFTPTLMTPATSDTGEITWDAAQRLFTLNAPAARLLIGRAGGRTVSVGEVTFQVGPLGGNEHAHIGLVALDGKPIATSNSLFLVAIGRAENQNMGWNAQRTSVGNQWGAGPALVQGVGATITLPTGGWRVLALDPTGAPQQPVADGATTFTISPNDRTVWYLLTRM